MVCVTAIWLGGITAPSRVPTITSSSGSHSLNERTGQVLVAVERETERGLLIVSLGWSMTSFPWSLVVSEWKDVSGPVWQVQQRPRPAHVFGK